MSTADLLAQGIAAARAGRADEARATLLKVLETDDRSEPAWLWLSGLLETPDERRVCLENVLTINPANAHARRGLELLSRSSPPAAPEAPPQQAEERAAVAVTSDTIELVAPPLDAAPAATLTLPAAPAEAGNAVEPCPYCGATTSLAQGRCPSCHKSLMVRGVRRDERSLALKILVVCYVLMTVSNLGSGMLQVAGLAAIGGEAGIGWLPGLIGAVFLLIGTALYAGFTLALWRRKLWAFVLHWIGVVLNLVGVAVVAIILIAMGGALPELLADMPAGEAGPAAGALGAMAGVLGAVVLCSATLSLLWLALTIACNGDFFGRKVRLSTAGVETAGDPYNLGLAYRDRGMWFMAAYAWQLAARAAPRDVTVRRALGLAYGQLRRFDEARAELRAALALAPGDTQLASDLALVERLAARG